MQLLDDAEQRVFQIAEQSTRGRRNFVPMKELMGLVMDRIDMLAQQDNPIIGISSGFNELDKMTAGLQPSDLIIVAGRPSMGKTSFAMNIAEHAAIKYAVPSVIFSMEMSAEQLALRMLSSLSRLDHNKVRTGKLEDDDWPRLSSTVGILGEAPLYIDDTPSLTPMDLRARARRLKRERGLGLIVVDYLQLMQVPGTKETRANEISEISRSLKALAKELNVPVIALSQLNRNLESRTDKRPVMSDLRESGGIEQDADLIMMIYRDEVYNEASPDKGTAEINIVKQRNGPIGGLRLTFLGQYTRFENFIPSVYTNEGYA
jgi:replicative DNA helicase